MMSFGRWSPNSVNGHPATRLFVIYAQLHNALCIKLADRSIVGDHSLKR